MSAHDSAGYILDSWNDTSSARAVPSRSAYSNRAPCSRPRRAGCSTRSASSRRGAPWISAVARSASFICCPSAWDPRARSWASSARRRCFAVARDVVEERGLTNVRLVQGDATATGLPRAVFDLVHERLLLMIPPDLRARALPGLLRGAGLLDVRVHAHAQVAQAGSSAPASSSASSKAFATTSSATASRPMQSSPPSSTRCGAIWERRAPSSCSRSWSRRGGARRRDRLSAPR